MLLTSRLTQWVVVRYQAHKERLLLCAWWIVGVVLINNLFPGPTQLLLLAVHWLGHGYDISSL